MPRVCTICQRADRPEIDRALVSGEAMRGIARRAAISVDALERHAKAHLPAAIVKAQEAEDVANGDNLLRQITDLQKRTLAILTAAEGDDGDARVALVAIHQARENLVLLSKLMAELNPVEDARSLAEQLKRAKAEPRLTVRILDRDVQLELLREAELSRKALQEGAASRPLLSASTPVLGDRK